MCRSYRVTRTLDGGTSREIYCGRALSFVTGMLTSERARPELLELDGVVLLEVEGVVVLLPIELSLLGVLLPLELLLPLDTPLEPDVLLPLDIPLPLDMPLPLELLLPVDELPLLGEE